MQLQTYSGGEFKREGFNLHLKKMEKQENVAQRKLK